MPIKMLGMQLLFLFTLTALLTACTKSSSDSSEGGGPSEGSRPVQGELAPQCGVIVEGSLRPSAPVSLGLPVRIEDAVSAELVIVRDLSSNEQILVSILGVGPARAGLESSSRDVINSYRRHNAYLFVPQNDCEISLDGGGRAILAQVITANGDSLAEALLASGSASGDFSALCGANLLAACLGSLEVEQPVSAGELNAFLWKPISESDGKLAIHTGPYNTVVIVSGEQGQNRGPGNGYGSLARFSRPGCGYPNPQIEVRDGFSGKPYTVNGRTRFSVPNPCERYCLRGGEIVACPR